VRRLLRLSLEGFKTFSGRAGLDLGAGLTSIVGPNGSGKSNLVDAIAWAVGDRSWKSLRGEGMEDLLFRGDDRHEPAVVARVTLSFANEDRLLGIDFSEVTVTRELRRGEGSRVLLNGVEVKLKDVQSLLSGTGLVGGFSLIRQGVVDKFILAGPEDIGRRLEESANIASYRHRKQEAAERLRKVEANALEAERKAASLRRELGQVRERAARARNRRALEDRRVRMGCLLRAWEGLRLSEALAAVSVDEDGLRGVLAGLAREREERSRRRTIAEQELSRIGVPEESSESAPGPREIARCVGQIREAGDLLGSTADDLSRRGRAAWPQASLRLNQISERLQGIRAPGTRTAGELSGLASARLAELRELSAQEQFFGEEERRRSAALAALACERARLEERRAALGEAREPDGDCPPDFHPARAKEELETIERDLAGIGPVDETAEVREREIVREVETLGPVLEDLASSRAKLAAFVRQLETYTAQIFEETRSRVEARFRQYLSVLFEGGEGRLLAVEGPEEAGTLLDSDPSRVEVRVRLPRRPEIPLTLLSGGERSLAGIALVLALAAGDDEKGRLLVLDEVDAALDEGNAARLARLLRELQVRHQILCVTHNKLTMHQSTHLVGVTSGAASTSTLLKVRLDGADRGSPAA
jgi:chromosome segregation protein